MSGEETRENGFREAAETWSMNSLIWAGLALTNFVLSVKILTASSFKANILFEISASLFLLSGVFFASSWALFQAATGARKIKLKDRRTKEYVTNPREVYVKRAEYIALAGTLTWSAGTCFFLAFIGMFVTLVITVVALVLSYCYIYPIFPLERMIALGKSGLQRVMEAGSTVIVFFSSFHRRDIRNPGRSVHHEKAFYWR